MVIYQKILQVFIKGRGSGDNGEYFSFKYFRCLRKHGRQEYFNVATV